MASTLIFSLLYNLNIQAMDQLQEATGIHDFDFLMGKEWKVRNIVLKQRLVDCSEWVEFEAKLSDTRKFLDGSANMDKFYGYRNGEYFEAASIRIYNPQKDLWTIYWADNQGFEVTPQAVGHFKDGIGEFYGRERFKGEMVKLRFLWTDITEASAHWEQAYYDEDHDEWETNWIMEFSVTNHE